MNNETKVPEEKTVADTTWVFTYQAPGKPVVTVTGISKEKAKEKLQEEIKKQNDK